VAVFLTFNLAVSAIASLAQTTPMTATFFARRDYQGPSSDPIQVADANGDGIPDVIGNANGFVEVLFGNGDGTLRTGPSTDTVILPQGPSSRQI
jgi:hypothetical protein